MLIAHDKLGNLIGTSDGSVHAYPADTWDGMSDPNFTAMGSFGVHLATPQARIGTPFFMYARHTETLRSGPWGVVRLADNRVWLGEHEPIIEVTRQWRKFDDGFSCNGVVRTLSGCEDYFIKEPKVGMGSLRGYDNWLVVRDKSGQALKGWIAFKTPYIPKKGYWLSFTNPKRKTAQITDPRNRSVLLKGKRGKVSITFQSTFNRWLPWIKQADKLTTRDSDKKYCHCKIPRPSREIVRGVGAISWLAHECGTSGKGFHDCHCGYWKPTPGMTANFFFRVRFL